MKTIFMSLFLLCFSLTGFAQSILDEIDAIEAEAGKKKQTSRDQDVQNDNDTLKSKGDFSDLNRLVPFSEVAVIQKRYLPKTNRLQANLGLDSIMNNPFFQSQGLHLNLSYFLNETWGVEFSYVNFSTSEKLITKDLQSEQGVKTSSLAFPKTYLGMSLMMVPFYGKISWLNQRIVPFDFFFTVGGGQTTTSYKDQGASTVHLGTGQLFAISKSFALRWDLSYNMYTAKAAEITSVTATTVSEISQTYADLFLGVGLSWFFPGATYR